MSYGGENMKPTLTIRLPEDVRSTLQEISKEEQKPVSDIVRESGDISRFTNFDGSARRFSLLLRLKAC
jgi:hypothetical protein